MAPRAMKYDFVSSTLVDVRSVSPRTLFATAKPEPKAEPKPEPKANRKAAAAPLVPAK